MNELIKLIKAQRAIINSAENEFAKAKFSVGDSVAFTCKKRGTIVGNITKVKLKRANVMTTTGSWDVPLTMLEVA